MKASNQKITFKELEASYKTDGELFPKLEALDLKERRILLKLLNDHNFATSGVDHYLESIKEDGSDEKSQDDKAARELVNRLLTPLENGGKMRFLVQAKAELLEGLLQTS